MYCHLSVTSTNQYCQINDWLTRSYVSDSPTANSPSFYRAMLRMRGVCYGPVSVRLSDTSRCSTKTAKRRITCINNTTR